MNSIHRSGNQTPVVNPAIIAGNHKNTPPAKSQVSVPLTLMGIPQWVCWKYGSKPNRKGKLPKYPINPHTGKLAKTDNPATWGTYAQAAHLFRQRQHKLHGIGFVLSADLGLVVIDLDDAITPDEQLAPFAQSVVDQVDGWTEVSPSGTGLHIFAYGHIPASVKTAEIEIYSADRYITITGDRWPGTPADIPNRAKQVAALYIEVAKPKASKPETQSQPAQPVGIADAQLVACMFGSRNGEQLRRLWDGDISEYPSHSEADQALCNALSFWTGRDAERIDTLFRQSGLYREKWDKQHYGDGRTYGQETIAKALGVSKVYSPVNDPFPQYDGTVQDILKFARQVVSEHRFAGRRAEYSRQCALGAVKLLEKANSLEAPMSKRYLAVASGVGEATAYRALSGTIDPKTKGRITTPDTLTNWLLECVETGNGITANVFTLHAGIRSLYVKESSGKLQGKTSDSERNGTSEYTCEQLLSEENMLKREPHSEAHSVDLILCGSLFSISRTIEGNMTDDAYARPSFKKGHKRRVTDQKPADGWNAIDDNRDDLVRLFGALGGAIIDTLLTRESATIAQVATATGNTVSDVARSVILLRKTYPDLISLTPPVTRETVLALPNDIDARFSAILDKANRMVGLSRLMNTAVDDDPGLKSFTPIGLALVATLETVGDLSLSELAKRLDKDRNTIAAAVERMSAMLEKNGLEPILATYTDPTDRRKTIVHLYPDWRQRVADARPHLCTDGINRQRNIAYALERLERLRNIAETARNPETLTLIERIQTGAQKVLDWSEGRLRVLHQQLDQVEGDISRDTGES